MRLKFKAPGARKSETLVGPGVKRDSGFVSFRAIRAQRGQKPSEQIVRRRAHSEIACGGLARGGSPEKKNRQANTLTLTTLDYYEGQMEAPPPPIFTLRAHKSAVTALAHIEPQLLISGDEDGNITLWDQDTFKRVTTYENVCDSKVLSLKTIRLDLDTCLTDVLVLQSRNDGVYIIRCDENFKKPKCGIKIDPSSYTITNFPAYCSLFSRGDSKTIESNRAILAYPSSLESYLVTVRFVGRNADTEISGSAARTDQDVKRQQSSVFDILISDQPSLTGRYYLFVGYEDGSIVVYSFGRDQTETVPELNVTGLKIEVVKTLDLGITDFVSAFDLTQFDHNCANLVCGSATKELRFIRLDENLNPNIELVKLSKPGTSVLSIRPDLKLVAAGGWDNTIRLYSLKSKRFLATLKNHTKQVSTILFLRKENATTKQESNPLINANGGCFLMCCASLDGTISIFDVY